MRVLGARGTLAHAAGDTQHELAAHALGDGEGRGIVRIEHHLGQAGAVAQIDEDHPTVIAAAAGPAA
ncbi:MAG: hypothetical protein A2V58_07920 [Candidatus Muproteobacteria bacterium RBG_19FT_COMBO_61_10]|uniref:Uncharacterized protein n=1 Tax=Candidatus Muproteobacteria bacterium RBG_19FT_COMBO_61_10 TaxID=1817761 RepID=A0A1F6UP12_9PROT|nr:MAG: hypothetical protein A2V58_07920 [Candidatus Muproteobacteria bacterium RBG_19FT_COMBO_61_10]